MIDASSAVLVLAGVVGTLCSDTAADASTTCRIDDETSALYTPGDDDVGHTLHAVATYQDDQGDSTDEVAGASSEKVAQEANPANTAPEFPDQDLNTAGDQSDTAMRSVAENAEEGTEVGQPLEAEDENKDLLTYSLSGADAASFKLSKLAEDSNSVHILTDVELDFESQSMHTVVLTAMDPSGAMDKITVMIEVTDADDVAVILTAPAVNTPPAFSSATATRNVDENMDKAKVGDPVTAADEDSGDSLTYSLSETGYFEIDASSGQITTTMMLDYEAMSTHMVTVTATDEEGATDSVDVTINVGERPYGLRHGGRYRPGERLRGAPRFGGRAGRLTQLGGRYGDERLGRHHDERRPGDGGQPEGPGPGRDDPGALGRLSALTSLNLRSNADLSGEIPGALNYLTNLTVLNLHSNSHTGEIPDLSGTALQGLYLSNNDLTGSVPAWLNMMSDLTDLWLTGNDLAGAMPNLSGMTSLNLRR